MSKLLKAQESTQITPFDFLAIDMDPEVFGPAESSTVIEAEEPSTNPDPLHALEQIVQDRLHEVERRAQELEKEAYEKGYAQGQKDGFEYGQKSMQIVKEQMEQLLGGLQSLPEKVFEDYRTWFIDTCLAVARRVVQKELEVRPEALIQLIGNLLDEAEDEHRLIVHVHPKDLGLIEKYMDQDHKRQESERAFVLKPDADMRRGGCRLESDLQLLDATIDTQFALIEAALYEPFPSEAEPETAHIENVEWS